MKSILLLLAFGLLLPARWAEAAEHFVFKAAAGITFNRTEVGEGPVNDKIIVKTLTSKDIINLTLGRPLGTKVDTKKEVLALAVAIEGPGAVAAPSTRVIIFNSDPAVTGAARVVATVATLSNLDFDAASLAKGSKGQGVGQVNLPETTTGTDPVNNKFFPTTLSGSGIAAAPSPETAGDIDGFAFSLISLSGDLHLRYKLANKPAAEAIDFSAIVTKGIFKTTGKPIATVDL